MRNDMIVERRCHETYIPAVWLCVRTSISNGKKMGHLIVGSLTTAHTTTLSPSCILLCRVSNSINATERNIEICTMNVMLVGKQERPYLSRKNSDSEKFMLHVSIPIEKAADEDVICCKCASLSYI